MPVSPSAWRTACRHRSQAVYPDLRENSDWPMPTMADLRYTDLPRARLAGTAHGTIALRTTGIVLPSHSELANALSMSASLNLCEITFLIGSLSRLVTMKSSMRGTDAGRYIDENIIRFSPPSSRGSKVVG